MFQDSRCDSGSKSELLRTASEPTPWITYSLRPKSLRLIKGNFGTWTQLGLFNNQSTSRALTRLLSKRGSLPAHQKDKKESQAVKVARLSCHRFRVNRYGCGWA
jgi:hypothetical protein